MLQTIHTIDLLYYKKLFVYLNNKANENKEEEDELSPQFVMSFVERAFAFVEEVFNSDNTFHLDGLSKVMEETKFIGNLVEYVEIEITKIREKAHKAGWDPRIKIKVDEHRIASAYQVLQYRMDLEATYDAMANIVPEEVYAGPFTEKEIVDNPDAEALNDWFDQNKT